MIDKLVSRFLYVLCWRNKVVIILIILSASMAMLMMLSYHGSNKHQMTVDDILHSGKGHIPIDHQFGKGKSKSHLGSTGAYAGNHEAKPRVQVQGQSVQRRFLERNIEIKKPPDEHLVPTAKKFAKLENNQDPEQGARRDKPYLKAPEGNTIYDRLPAVEQVLKENVVVRQKEFHMNQQAVQASTLKPRPLLPNAGTLDGLGTQRDKGIDHKVTSKRKWRRQSLIDANINDVPSQSNRFEKKVSSLRMRNSLRNREEKASAIIPEQVPDKPVQKLRKNKLERLKKGWRNPNSLEKRVELNVRGTDKPLEHKVKIENQLNAAQGTPLAHMDNQQNQVPIMRNNQGWWEQNKSPKMNPTPKESQHEEKAVPPKRDDTLRLQGGSKKLPAEAVPPKRDDLLRTQGGSKKLSAEAVPPKRDDTLRTQGGLKKLPADQAYQNKSPHDLRIQKLEKLRKSLDAIQKDKLNSDVDKLRNRLINYTKDLQNLRRFVKDPKPPSSNEKGDQAAKDSEFPWRPTTTPAENRLTPNISSMILALARQRKPVQIFSPYHASSMYRRKDSWPEMFSQWVETEERYCDDHFVVMNSEFAILKDVIIDRNFCHGRNGGEEIHEVINQPEDEEYYTYFPGFFQLTCQVKPQYFFNNNNHLNQWLYSISSIRDQNLYSEMRQQFTIAIVRYEYANMYHTTTDFYNAFLLMEFFNKTQGETNILLIDGHPKGALDPVWDVLFNSSHRINKQSTRTKYPNLVWGILGYNSPMMDHYAPNIPLIEEFRTFFLSSYRITNTRKVDCDKINILFIWRRDYVAHPRNPSGSISRKIQNEQELVGSLRQNFPSFSVKGIQIDLFEMDQQLKFITETDVLIGMHGAGLTHAMFLPKHAGMIELLPTYWSAANEHFHAIARWRHLHYRQWVNADPQNEAPNHFTKIPPEVLNELVTDMVKVVCGLATDPPDVFVAQ